MYIYMNISVYINIYIYICIYNRASSNISVYTIWYMRDAVHCEFRNLQVGSVQFWACWVLANILVLQK